MENFPGLQFEADAVASSAGTADGMLCFGNGEQFLHPLPSAPRKTEKNDVKPHEVAFYITNPLNTYLLLME